jgi:sec-independent protein translocase protein TatC
MHLLDHLEELRTRLFRSIVALALATLIGYFVAPWPLQWLAAPLERIQQAAEVARPQTALRLSMGPDGTLRVEDPAAVAALGTVTRIDIARADGKPVRFHLRDTPTLLYLRPMDPFLIRLKASFVIGLMLAMPVLLFQLWGFIGPGLLPSERRLALPMAVSGSVLFPVGATFAYFLLDVTLEFFAGFAMAGATMMNDANAYLGFALSMMLAFGVVFQLPLVVVLATRVGLVSTSWLAERRRIIFVSILILSAVVTPSGDPFTLMAMGLPLYLLFEIALFACRVLDRARVANPDESGDAELKTNP